MLLFPCSFDFISEIFCLNMQIQINQGDHNCASTQRVVSKMANIGWVAERAISLLKRNPQMGAKTGPRGAELQVQGGHTISDCVQWHQESS